MKRIALSSLMAAGLAVATTGLAAQRSGDAPGQPNPTDRGGEFELTGCLTRPSPQPAGGAVFVLTDATSQTGEARLIGAMGAGVPTTAQRGGAQARPTDPPEIVESEYRVVADDADLDLAKHVNHKVRMRGALMDQARAPQAGSNRSGEGQAQGAGQRNDGMPQKTFIAGELESVADSCS
jgi:hypothetical protein